MCRGGAVFQAHSVCVVSRKSTYVGDAASFRNEGICTTWHHRSAQSEASKVLCGVLACGGTISRQVANHKATSLVCFHTGTNRNPVQCFICDAERNRSMMIVPGMFCRHGSGIHALIKPTKSAPSPTNGPPKYPRFRYRMLLSFYSPPSSANRVGLAVFWKSTARPSSARGFRDCVGQRSTWFLEAAKRPKRWW